MKLLGIILVLGTMGTAVVLMDGQRPGAFEMSGTLRSACSDGQKGFLCGSGVRATRGGSTVFIATD